MTTNPFAAPAPPGQGITWQELNGALLLIEPIAIETGIKTAYDAADAVRATVTVLDGDQAGTEYADTLVFPKVLQNQLKSRIGQKVLGRLGQGQAKPGQSPPWLLNEATPQDQQVGIAYLNQKQAAQVQQPAAAPQAAAPVNQWQQPQQQSQGGTTQQVPF